MEIKKLEVNIEKKRRGIINVYLIPHLGCMNSDYLLIDEFHDKYNVLALNKQKIALEDLCSAIYEFIISNYFDEQKPFIFGKNCITFEKNTPYPTIFQILERI